VTQREKLTEALRNEFARTEPEPLDDFAAGVAAALQRRGITSVPGATRPEKPWSRQVLDTLLDDKAKTEQALAQREAEKSAPPPPASTAELVKQALKIEVEKLNRAEAEGSDPGPVPALNSAQLLRLAAGQHGTANRW
jgi:hypothetical protein